MGKGTADLEKFPLVSQASQTALSICMYFNWNDVGFKLSRLNSIRHWKLILLVPYPLHL